ncbi:hypothetical protein EU537_09090 [Candidatus Thorarchaeota archaeon]|nr:MAG: hypothetical protein EU537_09090 [Candidatus Thorarchaeota archaeon]
MSRTPIDVYRGIVQTRVGDESSTRINRFVDRFSGLEFAEEDLSLQFSRMIGLGCRLVAYLDSRYVTGLADLTISIDLVDHLATTTKWWKMTRQDPSIVLRPRVRDPRELMKSLSEVSFDANTKRRIADASDKLSRFLEEQEITWAEKRKEICDAMTSTWRILAGFICRSEGRNTTIEADFERAYDVLRILLFYVSLNDFKAIVAVRKIASSPKLSKAAAIKISPGFERLLETSMASRLESKNREYLSGLLSSSPGSCRNILTNSLRLLAQLQAVKSKQNRLEKENYEPIIRKSIDHMQEMGIPSDFVHNEASVLRIFKSLKPAEGLNDKIASLTRRLEGMIVDSTGNRDFLLQYSKLVTRLISLVLLIGIGTKNTKGKIHDEDIKRGLMHVQRLISA